MLCRLKPCGRRGVVRARLGGRNCDLRLPLGSHHLQARPHERRGGRRPIGADAIDAGGE